jgi:hypothetical protein
VVAGGVLIGLATVRRSVSPKSLPVKVDAVGEPDFVRPLGRQIVGWPGEVGDVEVAAADVAMGTGW